MLSSSWPYFCEGAGVRINPYIMGVIAHQCKRVSGAQYMSVVIEYQQASPEESSIISGDSVVSDFI
jgi:hypothetical protein